MEGDIYGENMVIGLFGGGPMGRRATWRLRRARALSSGDALSVAALRGLHRIRNADFEPEKFTAMKRAPRRRGRFSMVLMLPPPPFPLLDVFRAAELGLRSVI